MSSLVCAVADTGIANAYGTPTEGWYYTMMDEGDLRPTVSTSVVHILELSGFATLEAITFL